MEIGGRVWGQSGESSSPESSSKRVREGARGREEGSTQRLTQRDTSRRETGTHGDEEKEERPGSETDPENASDKDSEAERPALRESRQV